MKGYKALSGVLIIFIVSAVVFINIPYKSTEDYLGRNHSDLNLEYEEDFSGLDILSKDIKDKKIILAGEYHNLAQNNVVFLKLLKYFQQEIGVNYLLEEVGSADAYFLNKYLESGDENILKEYFNIYINQKLYTEERYNDFVEIYNFNQTLPEEERIKVVGIDVESQATYEYLIDVTKEKEDLTNELEVLIKQLKDFDYFSLESYEEISEIASNLMKDIEKNKNQYNHIFGEEFENFKFVIKNLIQLSEARMSGGMKYDSIRDKYIYENFKEKDSVIQDAIYFGQWGGYHIFQDTMYRSDILSDIDYFASLLNKDVKYNGKILSIQYGYYQEKEYFTQYNQFSMDKNLFKDYLGETSKATLFKLNNKKSPFKEESINPFSTSLIDYKGNPITNYIQYLILIQNSKPSTFVTE